MNFIGSALVNEPQGSAGLKLSFERLKLLPGEATKLSVCLQPDAAPGAFGETGFWWRVGDNNYYAGFGQSGSPVHFQKGFAPTFEYVRGRPVVRSEHDAAHLFDVDGGNRVLTFARL